jgi:hypothetical protein
MKRLLKKQYLFGLIAGVIYGLLIRLIPEIQKLSGLFEIISFSFLIFTPIAVGAVSVYVASKKEKLTWKNHISVSSTAMLVFLLSMFVFLLEGLVCIVLILPVFIIASIVGGLIIGYIINNTKYSKSTLNSMLILPLLLSPIESFLPLQQSTQQITTRIIINASAQEIFSELATVKNIKSDELGFSFMHFIGLPKPLEASMNGHGVGAVRTSKWEKGVSFEEKITVWHSPYQLYYKFNIPKGSVPREALDRHVELGGDYFTVVSGGYDVKVLDNNQSELTLTTLFKNKSRLQLYGNLWAKYVLNDFHYSLLRLMKSRAENNNT